MYLDKLKNARSRCIAYYVCSGESIGDITTGNYKERHNKAYDDYKICCQRFADRICDSIAHYTTLSEHDRGILIEDFTASLDAVITEFNLTYCELGMKIGFTMAMDLGLQGYKNSKGGAH